MFEGLGAMMGNWGSQAGDWIKNNPEQFAMGLDMAGQAFDPNNVAAGVGTKLSQASLMNKAQKESETKANAKTEQQQQWWQQLLGGAMGGKFSAVGAPGASNMTMKQDGKTGSVTVTGDLASALAGPNPMDEDYQGVFTGQNGGSVNP